MAFVTDFQCKECKEEKHEVYTYENICQDCRSNLASKKKRMFLSSLKGLTIEERLNRIEEVLYDLNINNRLKSLESYHIQY